MGDIMNRSSAFRAVVIAAIVAMSLGTFEQRAHAATTNVPCDPTGAALLAAVNAAAPGDTLILASGCVYSFAASSNATEGPSALVVNKALTVIGNDATIERASGAPAFRIIRVASPGD